MTNQELIDKLNDARIKLDQADEEPKFNFPKLDPALLGGYSAQAKYAQTVNSVANQSVPDRLTNIRVHISVYYYINSQDLVKAVAEELMKNGFELLAEKYVEECLGVEIFTNLLRITNSYVVVEPVEPPKKERAGDLMKYKYTKDSIYDGPKYGDEERAFKFMPRKFKKNVELA